jgi:hypothetical protein
MAEFAFTDSYYRFAQTVTRRSRYIQDDEVRAFLAAVMETSAARKDSIEKSSILFRAQRGYSWRTEKQGPDDEEFEIPDAHGPARMTPTAEFAGDGRVNPRGIPCLYLASTKETAMAEVRPWVGSYIYRLPRNTVRQELPQFTVSRPSSEKRSRDGGRCADAVCRVQRPSREGERSGFGARMSHVFPKHRKRDRNRREKRPQLRSKPAEPIAAAKSPAAGVIGELARPIHAIAFAGAFAEALKETQRTNS